MGYMLYQKHQGDNDLEELKVVRFGSKSLNKWQQSYGPTKLELLGLVTAVVDCSSYLRGYHFIVECDHQALRPLFQKKFKGAIYDRWLALLQQYNFDIQYKPAAQMLVPDALSRCTDSHVVDGNTSPDEAGPFFPYVTEHTGEINLPEGVQLHNILGNHSLDCVNNVRKEDIVIDQGYLADSEDISDDELKPCYIGTNCSSKFDQNYSAFIDPDPKPEVLIHL